LPAFVPLSLSARKEVEEAEEVEFVEVSTRVELFRKGVVVVEKRMIGNSNCSSLYNWMR
jgi:hypothetical protein